MAVVNFGVALSIHHPGHDDGDFGRAGFCIALTRTKSAYRHSSDRDYHSWFLVNFVYQETFMVLFYMTIKATPMHSIR